MMILANGFTGGASSIGEWFQLLYEGLVSLFLSGGLPEGNEVANSFLGRLIIAIIIYVPFYIIIRIIIYLLKKPSKKVQSDPSKRTYQSFIASTTKVFLYAILIFSILSTLGFPLSGLSQVISSAVVAIGLSLQSVISNFAAGVIIITTKKFLKGDFINLNKGAVEGTVYDIKILETKILTIDNVMVSVSNNDLFTGIVANYSVMQYRRIDLTISVDYNEDVDEIKKILRYVVNRQKGVNMDMAISIFVRNFNNSAIDFAVRCYVPSSIYWDVLWDLNENIFKELVKRNVEIPYNQLDVHINKIENNNRQTTSEDIKEKDVLINKNLKDPQNITREDQKDDAIDQILDKFNNSIKGNKINKRK